MQNFTRRLMSGASLALLAFGAPAFARAGTSQTKPNSTSIKAQLTTLLGAAGSDGYAVTTGVSDQIALDASLLAEERSHVEESLFLDYEALVLGAESAASEFDSATSRLRALDLAHTSRLNSIAPIEFYLYLQHYDAPDLRHDGEAVAFGFDAEISQTQNANHFSNTHFYSAYVQGNSAHGIGIYQHDPAASATNSVINNENGVLEGFATGTRAYAAGVSQVAIANHFAGNYVSNEKAGFIGAGANAYDSAFLYADATGIAQRAKGTHAANSVFNGGTIEASAHAGYAISARAFGVGINQDPAANVVSNYVDNEGLVVANAVASGAFVYDYATAVGVHQSGGPLAQRVTNTVVNGAGATIEAFASAEFNFYLASAQAHGLAIGVGQYADAHTADNYVSNSGLVAAQAIAQFVGYAYASADGVYQAADGAQPSNSVHNGAHGRIVAAADAFQAAEFAGAVAAGVYQKADASSAYNGVSNLGAISAVADAGGRYTADAAAAHGWGIHQSAGGVKGNATNHVYNAGTVIAIARASGAFDASAGAMGVGQTASAPGHYARNSVTNHGFIGAGASASANADAAAYAAGIHQVAGAHLPAYAATNVVLNSDTIVAVADVHNAEYGYASAAGVAQRALGDPAYNYVSNNAFIGASAHASASFAYAYAHGVSQHASATGALGKAANAIDNYAGGTIVAFAGAFVDRDTGGGVAYARAVGITQGAAGATVMNYVDNSGFVGAGAHATGFRSTGFAGVYEAYHASANATAIRQDPAGNYAHNTVLNEGTVVAVASAHLARYVGAHALGIGQVGFAGTAQNYVTNSDVIAASAHAYSGRGYHTSGKIFAAFDAGFASATATGIEQEAGGKTSHYGHNVVLNAGTIAAVARASTANYQYAHAAGVHQIAQAHSAHNYVSNAEFIGASAVAKGGGATVAYSARAHALGISQSALALNPENVVHNGGTIAAFASAANAYDVRAQATGVHQTAVDFPGGIAANYVSNIGLIAGIAIAKDGAYAGSAFSARATATGVSQSARGYVAYNSLINHGAIAGFASASDAHNVRVAANGVTQSAAGGARADNYVANSGRIGAIAHASGGTTLVASAFGVSQHATANSGTAVDRVGNKTGKTIAAIAYASGDFGNASVTAYAVGQRASAPELAANYVSNHGLIAASAHAHGSGAGSRNWNDRAFAAGVHEFAGTYTGSGNAFNSVRNHGTIAGYAAASHATGVARAQAWGIYQAAFAETSARNYVSNSGKIAGIAIANTAGASAYAHAFGIDQYADPAHYAYNAIDNHSGATVGAFASAKSASHVYAYALGAYQVASASTSARNYVSNHGLIVGAALAHGPHYADTGNVVELAIASAFGVYQSIAYDGDAGYNLVGNSATIAGFARAYYADNVLARAEGILQTGGASSTGNAVYNAGNVVAVAAASFATHSALARATGVSQVASGTAKAVNALSNQGFIGADAIAYYAGTYARAFATGVFQAASASDIAYNSVHNHAEIAAFARATQGSDSGNYAFAYAFGVHQGVETTM